MFTIFIMNHHVRTLTLVMLLIAVDSVAGQSPSQIWETSGFDAFRKGAFDSAGANLYLSRQGTVQTVHRFDVNNDGYFDLAFANTHDRVHVLPAYQYQFRGSSRIQPARFEYWGAGSVRVQAIDLNGDARPELVIGRGDDNTSPALTSSIYWGSEEGWNERWHSELPTPNLKDFCVGDMNGDGNLDLVMLASSSNNGSQSLIYWGSLNGFFYQNRTSFQTPFANGGLVADLDADGRNDLVVTATNGASQVMWGSGKPMDPSLTTPLPVEVALGAYRLGKRLLLATPEGPKLFSVLNRHFQLDESIDYPGAGRLAVAELNGDGTLDLVVTRPQRNKKWETTSRIFYGASQSNRETYKDSSVQDLPTLGAVDCAVSDIDGDGFPDIVFANSRDNDSYSVPSYVYWGAVTGYSESQRSEVGGHGPQTVSVLKNEVLLANTVIARRKGDIDSYIYLGDKHGQYSSSRRIQLPTVGGYEACISDLNDDGYVDVLMVNSHEDAPEAKVRSTIFWGHKEGLAPARRTELPTRGGIGCAVADVDSDGYLDLLIANLGDDTASLFRGGADDRYGTREQILQVKDARFPAIADLNKDGWLDLVIPSVKEGLFIFWGSSTGYQQENHTLLPGIGAVGQQIADLDGDGHLDIVLCNLMDESTRTFQGINSTVYWGSPQGYTVQRRMDLPSLGGQQATIADLNRDGFLDIFVTNYQSEFDRQLPSHIYWGDDRSPYSVRKRTALPVGSGSGTVAADFNGDGWIDIAVANHFEQGSHLTNSYVFWNSSQGFNERQRTSLPTAGTHLMTGVDPGNIYTRALEEKYTSAVHDSGIRTVPTHLVWEGTTPFDSKLRFEFRGANSTEEVLQGEWHSLGFQTGTKGNISVDPVSAKRFWQYRVTFLNGWASSTTLNRVSIQLSGE